jgi:hypothetical protein
MYITFFLPSSHSIPGVATSQADHKYIFAAQTRFEIEFFFCMLLRIIWIGQPCFIQRVDFKMQVSCFPYANLSETD